VKYVFPCEAHYGHPGTQQPSEKKRLSGAPGARLIFDMEHVWLHSPNDACQATIEVAVDVAVKCNIERVCSEKICILAAERHDPERVFPRAGRSQRHLNAAILAKDDDTLVSL
jgi:hypothetical protein